MEIKFNDCNLNFNGDLRKEVTITITGYVTSYTNKHTKVYNIGSSTPILMPLKRGDFTVVARQIKIKEAKNGKRKRM